MAKIDDVLNEVRELRGEHKHLVVKLYGENGFEGDMSEIKKDTNEIPKMKENIAIHNSTLYGHGNDPGLVKQVAENRNRIMKMAIIVAAISATVGGGVAGLIQLFG